MNDPGSKANRVTNPDVTQILGALERGDSHASEQLLPLVYEELRKLAAAKMSQEASDRTLQPTALVHEAYLRLVGNGGSWENRGHFFAAAAEAMRRILIEEARRRASLKRGGEYAIVDLPDDLITAARNESDSLLDLDVALHKLQTADPESYKLVMLRYFSGLTVDEAAESLGISPRTAKRYWSFARAWLQREIERQ
ncbi:sigma-70 family RNA polymerase sigma factor [Blastopirellula sp. JC732]|uniref:Sigma-70 family RNA polymerase sigma factor n=1 Tax=Blastopirellula sediminis TaxID=2894196 RepID=A0A9X1MKJ3_9BACT|nr:sigma-70 family RNA polymerase sigma factor [Blastopirellula sediminis]MCC9608023.1 sigma-70 family RNA polymerase sigma factor [Blastopirellula sediminis]MCC9627184.1 sigma-70 family RNA polymerase sigma factor [Blastopirellula sediminis]